MTKLLPFLLPLVAMVSYLLLSLPASGQTTAQDLSPEANKALQKDMIAAEQKAWPQAIRYFGDAQQQAPFYPPVLNNLGLAHLNAGHDLPAIAWLNAYTAAAPQASNLAAVRDVVARREVAVEITIETLLDEALTAAKALPLLAEVENPPVLWDVFGKTSVEYVREDAFDQLLEAFGAAGYVEALESTYQVRVGLCSVYMPACQSDPYGGMCMHARADCEINPESIGANEVSLAFYRLGRLRLVEGNIAGAREALTHIPKDAYRSTLIGEIALAYDQAGSQAAAENMLASLPAGSLADEALKKYVQGVAIDRDLDIDRAIAAAERMSSGIDRAKALLEIADFRRNQQAAVDKALGHLQSLGTPTPEQADTFIETWLEAATLQARAGDTGAAAASISRALEIPFDWNENWELNRELATAQMAAGKLDDAAKAVEALVRGDQGNNCMYTDLVEAFLLADREAEAKQFMARIDDAASYGSGSFEDAAKYALAAHQARTGRLELAEEMTLTAGEHPYDPYVKAKIIGAVARAWVSRGETEKAKELLHKVSRDDGRWRVINEITAGFIDADRLEDALGFAAAMGTAGEEVGDAYRSIAIAQIKQGRFQDAWLLIQENRDAFLEPSFAQRELLGVADAYIEAGQEDYATRVLQMFTQLALRLGGEFRFEETGKRFEHLNRPDEAAKVASYLAIVRYTDLARRLSDEDVAVNLPESLAEIRNRPTVKVPQEIAQLGVSLAKDLAEVRGLAAR